MHACAPAGLAAGAAVGVPNHVDELGEVTVTRFASGEEFRDSFRDPYGPTIVAHRTVGDDLDRRAALDRALVDLAGAALEDGRMRWEYLLSTATRA